MTDHVTDRALLSGRVKRYSTWPTITTQTVGDHCWGVYEIYFRIFGPPTAEIALYIHHHDSEELIVGDNPFPSKVTYPALKAGVTEAEVDARRRLDLPEPLTLANVGDRARVKICDLLEMMQFGMQEREMGNLLAQPIIERTRAAALDKVMDVSFAERQKVNSWILAEVSRHERLVNRSGSTL